MKSWPEAVRDGAISGSIASISTTAVLAERGKRDAGTLFAPTNAISHWFWGDRAAHRNDASIRYTLLGYAIHHASATLWAVLYEKWLGNKAEETSILSAVAGGASVAALACFVDYKVTPRRLHPGYEKRLSSQSLLLLYGIFGLTLTVRGLVSGLRRARCANVSAGLRCSARE